MFYKNTSACSSSHRRVHLSTNIPACTAWTMLLNLGFSSGRRFARPIFLLKVHASQSRTSLGTDSTCSSLSSSSVSKRRLQKQTAVTAGSTGDSCSTQPSVCSASSPGLISVHRVQHGSCELQVPTDLLQVHHTMIHLLQGPLQPDTKTHELADTCLRGQMSSQRHQATQ